MFKSLFKNIGFKVTAILLVNLLLCESLVFAGARSIYPEEITPAKMLSPALRMQEQVFKESFLAAEYQEAGMALFSGEQSVVAAEKSKSSRHGLSTFFKKFRLVFVFLLVFGMFTGIFGKNSHAAEFYQQPGPQNTIEYKVKIEKGDNLWNIAAKVYEQVPGQAKESPANNKWRKIFDHPENKKILGKRTHDLRLGKEKVMIYPGDTLILPGEINKALEIELGGGGVGAELGKKNISQNIEPEDPVKIKNPISGQEVKSPVQNVPPRSSRSLADIFLLSGLGVVGIIAFRKIKKTIQDYSERKKVLAILNSSAATSDLSALPPDVELIKQQWTASCEIARRALSRWKQILIKGQSYLTEQDLSEILNLSRQIISSTSFSIRDVDENINRAADIYEQMGEFSVQTLNIMVGQMHSTQRTNAEAVKIFYKVKELSKIAKYCVEYEFGLDCIYNLKIISGYIMPASTIWERWYFLPALRYVFGMKSGLNRSQRQIHEQLKKIIALGNQIEAGLYNDPKRSKSEINDYIRSVKLGEKKTRLGYDRFYGWILRKMLGRFIAIISLVMFSTTILPLLVMNPAALGIWSFAWRSALALGSIFISWWFLGRGKKRVESLYRHKNMAIAELESRLEGIALPPYVLGGLDNKKQMWSQEVELTINAAKQELSELSPGADIVMIMTGDDPDQAKKIRRIIFPEGKNVIFRNDIPVVFPRHQGAGSAMDYMEAWNYLSSPEFQKLTDKFPWLKGKKPHEIRAVIILAGGKDIKAMSRVIQPGLEFNGNPVKVIDWAIFSAYRGARKLRDNRQYGTVCFNADGVYVGPIDVRGEMTLLGAWTTYEDMIKQKLGLLVAGGDDELKKIYEKFNIDKIKNWLIRDIFLGRYDLNNQSKRQMLAFTGGIITTFETIDQQQSFMQIMKSVSGYGNDISVKLRDEENREFDRKIKAIDEEILRVSCRWAEIIALGDSGKINELQGEMSILIEERNRRVSEKELLPKAFSLSLVADFLVPVIMLNNDENIFTYLASRYPMRDKSFRDVYGDLFERYARWYRENPKAFTIAVNVPYPAETSYARSAGPEEVDLFPYEFKDRTGFSFVKSKQEQKQLRNFIFPKITFEPLRFFPENLSAQAI